MAVNVVFWNYTKLKNSTGRPILAEAPLRAQGELNSPTSIMTPVLLFNFDDDKVVPPYNYCLIDEFGRYYFITEWVWDSGFWQAYLTIDVLATYRSEIGNSNLYMLRCSAKFNDSVADTMYATLADRVSTCSLEPNPFYPNFANGYYVVGIINNDNRQFGATNYYTMTASAFRNFMVNLFANIDYMDININEISANLQKALINPFQYVVSAMWFPFNVDDDVYSTVYTRLPVGWWEVDGTCRLLSKWHHSGEYTIDVPKHPQSPSRGKWLNLAPYSTYSLEFWPWGEIPLDSAKLVNVSTLKLSYAIDYITGVGVLRVTGDTGDGAITIATTQVGVQIQVAQIAMNFGNLNLGNGLAALMGGAIQGAGVNNVKEGFNSLVSQMTPRDNIFDNLMQSVATGGGSIMSAAARSVGRGVRASAGLGDAVSEMTTNAAESVANGVKRITGLRVGKTGFTSTSGKIPQGSGNNSVKVENVLAGIGNAINSVLADVSVSGANGGSASFSLAVRVNAHFSRICDEDNVHLGRPLCEIHKPLDLEQSCFIKALNGDVTITSDYCPTQNEQELIKEYLEGGFYWVKYNTGTIIVEG